MYFVCFLTSFQSFDLLSVTSESTRPVLQQQICVYTLLLTGMTFNNNNNRRCLDLLATMATGISQRLLLCWWCPHRKIEGPTGSVCGIEPFSLLWWPPLQHWISIRKDELGGSHLLLLAHSLCEIHCLFVYPTQNRLPRREMFVCGSDLN